MEKDKQRMKEKQGQREKYRKREKYKKGMADKEIYRQRNRERGTKSYNHGECKAWWPCNRGTLSEGEGIVQFTSLLRFVKTKNIYFSIKSSRSKLASTRRSIVLIFPLQ